MPLTATRKGTPTAATPAAALLLALLFPAGAAGKPPESQASAKRAAAFSLRQLVQRARRLYPGVAAARHAVTAMQQQAYRAKWAWMPQAEVSGLLAPAPEVRCEPDTDNCTRTAQVDASSINIAGIFARIEVKIGMPLYTFDKIGSARRAAAAGVAARSVQVQAASDDVALKVTKAYWGTKLADELILTIEEGQKYLRKARERIDRQLDNDEGDVTVTDLLRLKTFTAEVDARLGEAKKLRSIAMDGIATLAQLKHGLFALDRSYLEPIATQLPPLKTCLRLAQNHRPEIEALRFAERAQRAAVDLEKAKFLPDFLLVAMFNYSAASGVDDPHNAFLSDPYNSLGFGFGLAVRWKLDTIQQVGKYRAAKAKARQVAAKRAEGLAGIELQIRKEYESLKEATHRLAATKKGQKAARSWLVATSQNLNAGLAEAKDLTDALLAYFQLRVRYLQAIFDVNTGWAQLARAVGKKTGKGS